MRQTRFAMRLFALLTLIGSLPVVNQDASGQNFQLLRTPPKNELYHPVTLQLPPPISLQAVPPSSQAIAVRVLQHGRVLRGSRTIAGEIESIAGNLVTFNPLNEAAITIGFALPGNTALVPRRKMRAIVTVRDFSSPLGADQELMITERGGLYAGFLWLAKRRANVVTLPDSIGRIEQMPDGSTVLFTTNNVTTPLGIGEVRRFVVGMTPYVIYVQTAMRQIPSWKREGDGAQQKYVLKAIVLADR